MPLSVVIKSISDAVDKASNGQGFDYEGAIGIVLLCTLLVPIVWFICNNGHFCLGDKIFACWPCGGRPMRLDPSAVSSQSLPLPPGWGLLVPCVKCCCAGPHATRFAVVCQVPGLLTCTTSRWPFAMHV